MSLRLVGVKELETNGFDLNIGRYIKGEIAAETNVEEALIAYRDARERLSIAETVLDEKLKARGFNA